jgi:hypothetical protein
MSNGSQAGLGVIRHHESVGGSLPVEERLSCWDDVLGTKPEATLPVRRAAFRQLLSGRAPSIEEVAAEAELAYETAREAADLVASVGMAEIDEGTIIGMDGLTTRRTRHRLVVAGVGLWTWCAYDIVGIAAALGTDAVASTRCGGCGRAIDLVIRKGRLDSAVVGWLPDASCSNVMAEFCPSALLFCSRSHLDTWRAREGIGSGAALDVESLAERGRTDWRQLVP